MKKQIFTISTLLTLGLILSSSSAIANNTPNNNLPKPVAYNYTGYSVQILEVDKELNEKHSIFKSFGDIKIQKEDGHFYYFVGEFKDQAAAQEYLEKVIVSRFPSAEIARYRDGVRIDLDE
ncbi:MAG: hypothetical protein ACPG19_05275 [Saprospiraceae bacterium]